jgi:putative OPT family oligopeptide transporter
MRNDHGVRELTVRSVILGGIITLLFTAANVYLGLKVGITFATSIPAAVISMALLRLIGNSNILENNIVQTIASAAGTLAAIIFVLPGLVMIGWWQGFPYWITAAVCAIGGTLGVMFSVPMRRALVTGSDLPYPEGVAAAEVLKVGFGSVEGQKENAAGLRMIIAGSLAAAGYALLGAMRLVASEVSFAFRVGPGATAASASLSLALIGVGHLVGLSVGAAMLLGMLIAWGGMVPILTAMQGVSGDVAGAVSTTFRTEVRFIGAGTIGVAALWSLARSCVVSVVPWQPREPARVAPCSHSPNGTCRSALWAARFSPCSHRSSVCSCGSAPVPRSRRALARSSPARSSSSSSSV